MLQSAISAARITSHTPTSLDTVSGQNEREEAAYNILQLPMSCSSEQVVFIQTSPPDERVGIVKPQHELRNLVPASSDCFMHGLLEHYTKRPTQMESVTLADFAA
ncbi:unnamed protein product [Gongylonema pulchrum]|uniref:Uncharacterized protein n=1 Tax=Gongylonema pulchrum TaxID=637853 RepID=A0A183E0L0_9BILA|nr:unnamed protein product [Gongylonema pulchrum]